MELRIIDLINMIIVGISLGGIIVIWRNQENARVPQALGKVSAGLPSPNDFPVGHKWECDGEDYVVAETPQTNHYWKYQDWRQS